MVKFLKFLKSIYVPLIFIVLEAIALNYYANSTSYTKAKLLSASNYIVGGVYEYSSELGEYFGMRKQNKVLLDEVIVLRNLLATYTSVDSLHAMVTSEEIRQYHYSTAHVINNSITRQENYITLNKGLRDDIEANMALLSPNGVIVGYVLACSERYSVCMSVLNTNFRTSGKFKKDEYFGSIYWDGSDHEYVTLSEIPKYAQITVGDTVVTTDYSSIFPPDAMIGTVDSWELKNSTYFNVKVKLATRVSALKDVIVVKYQDAIERLDLEATVSLDSYSQGTNNN